MQTLIKPFLVNLKIQIMQLLQFLTFPDIFNLKIFG